VGESESPDVPEAAPTAPALPTIKDLREKALARVEQKYLADLMALTRGNIREACRISGLSRSRLYLLLKQYNVSTTP
jgi:DNA-binding NtrC family response regulator